MNDRIHKLMSGHWTGPVAATLRATLGIGEMGYRWAINRRNRRFDQGIDVHTAGVPVVSIGNITAGGTGKTPVVAYVARYFERWGVRVALLSRGYRSLEASKPNAAQPESPNPVTENDELRVLAHFCPNIPHRQEKDRVAGAAYAIGEWGAELLVLDDGFQHRRLARDLDIVLVDATNPFGFGHLLPRGLLREPVTALRRAGLILITRADAIPPEDLARLRDQLSAIAPGRPIAEATFPPTRLINAAGDSLPLEALEETPLLAFCGIGNPNGFAATLAQAGLRAAELHRFPDHHHYAATDLEQLARKAHARGAAAAITTLKDLVKIQQEGLPGATPVPLWALETGCEITGNETLLQQQLNALLPRAVVGRHAA